MNYKIIHTGRKTIAIHVTKEAQVELRVPMKIPQKEIEKIVRQKQSWIEKTVEKMLRQSQNIEKIIITKETEQALLAKAKEILPQKIEYYSKLLGVAPTGIKISRAKTCWGSCSGKNSLNFSCRLMLADNDAIDYVVVHELAHIKEHNHSKRFWAVVKIVMPDYKIRKQKLNELQRRIFES